MVKIYTLHKYSIVCKIWIVYSDQRYLKRVDTIGRPFCNSRKICICKRIRSLLIIFPCVLKQYTHFVPLSARWTNFCV